MPSPQPRSTNHATHPITGRTVTQVNLPASKDPFDPSAPTTRNQDTLLPSQVTPEKLTQDQPRPTTCTTRVHGCHSELAHYQLSKQVGPQTINPPPNSTATTIALPITQTINNPIFSNQEHQTPASQETQQFPASSLPTPSQQQLLILAFFSSSAFPALRTLLCPLASCNKQTNKQLAKNIAAQSTPPRPRRRLQSQAIRNVSTNYLVHSQANPLDSQANADVTPLYTSQPQNSRQAKRAARDRISASSQPKRKCRKHGTPSTQVPGSQHLIIHQHHLDVTTTTSHVNLLFRDDSEDLTTPPTQPLPPSKRPCTRYLRQDTNLPTAIPVLLPESSSGQERANLVWHYERNKAQTTQPIRAVTSIYKHELDYKVIDRHKLLNHTEEWAQTAPHKLTRSSTSPTGPL